MAYLCDKEPDSPSVLRCPLRLTNVCVTVLEKMWPGPGPGLDKPGCQFWPRVCPVTTEGLLDQPRPSSFRLSNWGAGLSLPGWLRGVKETVPRKAPGPQQQGEPSQGEGPARVTRLSAAKALTSRCCLGPSASVLAPSFPEGSFVTSA